MFLKTTLKPEVIHDGPEKPEKNTVRTRIFIFYSLQWYYLFTPINIHMHNHAV